MNITCMYATETAKYFLTKVTAEMIIQMTRLAITIFSRSRDHVVPKGDCRSSNIMTTYNYL